jgi:phenylalanine-4-hydroxylase
VQQEATLYAPVINNDGGRISVIFAEPHPGYHDPLYREHRAKIAKAALQFHPGTPAPHISYTQAEHEVWRLVAPELISKHRRYGSAEIIGCWDKLNLPTDRLPQLAEASEAISRQTQFTFVPAAGLVEERTFYGSLADRCFQATQYIRHPSYPRFSPEPDMIHEIVGHGSHLTIPRWAALYELLGHTIRRLETDEAVGLVSRVFWFMLEYGLITEHGGAKVLGASLLSSCGELERYRLADIRPLDVADIGRQKYLVEEYQPVLFCAESAAHFEDVLAAFLTTVDDGHPLVAAFQP